MQAAMPNGPPAWMGWQGQHVMQPMQPPIMNQLALAQHHQMMSQMVQRQQLVVTHQNIDPNILADQNIKPNAASVVASPSLPLVLPQSTILPPIVQGESVSYRANLVNGAHRFDVLLDVLIYIGDSIGDGTSYRCICNHTATMTKGGLKSHIVNKNQHRGCIAMWNFVRASPTTRADQNLAKFKKRFSE